jgi:hypothetical protein
MKNLFLVSFFTVFVIVSGANSISAQTTSAADPNAIIIISEATPDSQSPNYPDNIDTNSPNLPGQATDNTKSPAQQLLRLKEDEVTKLTSALEHLRQLHTEGLIARVEIDKAEAELIAARSKVDELTRQVNSVATAGSEGQKTQQVATTKSFLKPTLYPLVTNRSVIRSTTGSWSIANLSSVEQFFSETFGKKLPTSAVGQSATHNRLGWNHRNSVDVGLHPDSVEGRALMSFLESSGIPFLAFRSAIRGVATGPHIHIGSPSQRIY